MVLAHPNRDGRSCTICGVFKPFTEFRKKARGFNGHSAQCKPCSNAKLDVWRARTRERRLAYNREYYASEKGRAVVRNYQAKKPAKKVAQTAVNRAIAAGIMVRLDACEECGSRKRVEGHHDDYAKPLAVRWLCRLCHKAWHRKNGEASNADLPVSMNLGIRAAQLERKAARLELLPKMLAGGRALKDIAKDLGVSYWTIWTEAKRFSASV
jgi:transposase-like protein